MWRELSFIVEQALVECWSDALLEAGALSVQAEDADANSVAEQALFGEPGMADASASGWQRTRLSALTPASQDHTTLLIQAGRLARLPAPQDIVTRVFDDQDWVRLTQSQFEPIPVGNRLLITPTWHLSEQSIAAATADSRITIILDPGLAFGTGSHPTTRLCLRWLEQQDLGGRTVIDYGCGSGILAIAAAKLGALGVIGVDIDPQALTSTQSNAQINQVSIDLRSTRDRLPTPADVVVANILATPLKLLAPVLQALVASGGYLVLAGLLERQIQEVADHYPQIALTTFGIDDGWACLAGSTRLK
jgi:ribosomal protein L11 methyltransferase